MLATFARSAKAREATGEPLLVPLLPDAKKQGLQLLPWPYRPTHKQGTLAWAVRAQGQEANGSAQPRLPFCLPWFGAAGKSC